MGFLETAVSLLIGWFASKEDQMTDLLTKMDDTDFERASSNRGQLGTLFDNALDRASKKRH